MPEARKGDTVKCIVDQYTEYARDQEAFVLDAIREAPGQNAIIKLANRKSPVGFAWYHAGNFKLVKRANAPETSKNGI